MIQRWTLTDPATSEVYRLPKNPRAMTPLHGPRRLTAERGALTSVVTVVEVPAGAFGWDFVGRLHTEAEHDALLGWRDRQRIVVTDHLARQHSVIPLAFEPTPVARDGSRNPWLFEYTFKTLYLGRLA